MCLCSEFLWDICFEFQFLCQVDAQFVPQDSEGRHSAVHRHIYQRMLWIRHWIVYPEKSKILTYGFHSEFSGSFEIPVRSHAPSTAGTCIHNRFDKGNTVLTNLDHLKRQLLAAGYDSFHRLRGRTDALAS